MGGGITGDQGGPSIQDPPDIENCDNLKGVAVS
jgi:hypothetical protein